jgi:hypothetical protein
MKNSLVSAKPRSLKPRPPPVDIPPMKYVGSMSAIFKEGPARAAVIAAAIPPGVAPYTTISYAIFDEQRENNVSAKDNKFGRSIIINKVWLK